MTIQAIGTVTFPKYSGVRCLMMPFIQGDPDSVPEEYAAYYDIIAANFLDAGAIGFLTIDESPVLAGTPHRGARARYGRALHTEAGIIPETSEYCWGAPPSGPGPWGPPSPSWGGRRNVTLDLDVKILLANNLDGSCAIWDAEHPDTSLDGDIGDKADMYPLEDATLMLAGDVHRIGILTPHESRPVLSDTDRQFLRIMGEGVHGREPYFTINPIFT